MSVHFGDFDESVRKIAEATNTFTGHMGPTAEVTELLIAVLNIKRTFDKIKENTAQRDILCRLFKKAHGHLSEVIRLTAEVDMGEAAHSSSARFYTYRGIFSLNLYRLGDDLADALSSATADLVKSIELNPAAETYTFLAYAYVEAGKLDDAMESLEKAIELDPEHAHAYLLKGRIHQANGETDAAYDNIYEAILLDPELYRDEFKPIVEDAEKRDAVWDETLRSPDSVAMLQEMVDKSRRASGKKK